MKHNITFINEHCVYANKNFWKNNIDNLENFYEENTIKNNYNEKIEKNDFILQYLELNQKASDLEIFNTIADQVQYNIDVGKEFIALFREEFVRTPLKEMTSLDIAQKTANLIPLILTGSFREACDLLRLYEPDEFMTRERIDKYIAMLTSADAIDYNYEETNTEESTTVSENEEENVVENFTEELEEN